MKRNEIKNQLAHITTKHKRKEPPKQMTVYNVIYIRTDSLVHTADVQLKGSFVSYDEAKQRFDDIVSLVKQNDPRYPQAKSIYQTEEAQDHSGMPAFVFWTNREIDSAISYYEVKVVIEQCVIFDNRSLASMLVEVAKPTQTAEELRKMYEYCQFILVMQSKVPERDKFDNERFIVHDGFCVSMDYKSDIVTDLARLLRDNNRKENR